MLGSEFVGGRGGGVKLGQKIGGRVCRGLSWAKIFQGAQFVRGHVGSKFWENPRSAGSFCRDFTEKKSPQCRAYTWALQMEKSISPLFPGPEGAVVANDWCIIGQLDVYALVICNHAPFPPPLGEGGG